VSTVLAREHATPSQYAERLRGRFADEMAAWQRAPVRVDDWAWESHRAGVEVAYGRLPRAIPLEPHAHFHQPGAALVIAEESVLARNHSSLPRRRNVTRREVEIGMIEQIRNHRHEIQV
jgi:hypothetical protein